jgi:hypothetical protein
MGGLQDLRHDLVMKLRMAADATCVGDTKVVAKAPQDHILGVQKRCGWFGYLSIVLTAQW